MQHIHVGFYEDKMEEERVSLEEKSCRPQQRKVRSLFLQPTWQHMLVTMLLKSRLVRWGLRLLLLLRLSKLFCSPAAKAGRIKQQMIHKITLIPIFIAAVISRKVRWSGDTETK